MDVSRALAQLAEIREQIAKGEIYRGYRPVPIAASGVIGLLAAWGQPAELGSRDPAGFVRYWTAVAAAAGCVGFSEILYNYLVHDNAAAKGRTRLVVGQFMPAVVAAMLITASFVRLSVTLVPLLPGLWAISYGLGTFASAPYLPRGTRVVALFYYSAGVGLLWVAHGPEPLTPWWVGGTFGVGQLLAAAVLYLNVERKQSL